eukprot:PhM_4_TR472/c1_g1_i2/m.27497
MTTHTNSSNETFISLTGCSRGTLISSTSSASLFALCPPQTPFQPPPLIAFPSTISTHNQQQEEEKEKEPEQQQINNSTTVQRCHSAPSIFERQTYSDVRRPSCPVILQISSSTSTSSFAIDMTPTKDIWHLWRIRPKRSLATVVRTEFASVLKCIGGVLLYALICAAPVSAYIIPATKYVYVPYHNTDNERHVAYFLVDSIIPAVCVPWFICMITLSCISQHPQHKNKVILLTLAHICVTCFLQSASWLLYDFSSYFINLNFLVYLIACCALATWATNTRKPDRHNKWYDIPLCYFCMFLEFVIALAVIRVDDRTFLTWIAPNAF